MALCLMFPVLNGKYSGALNVALNLALIGSRLGTKIKVIDYEDGLLRTTLASSNVEFEFLNLGDSSYSSKVSSADVVFGFNNDIYLYPCIFKKNNPKVFFYDVYYPFWSTFLRPRGIKLPFESVWLEKIERSKLFQQGMAFMDHDGITAVTERFGLLTENKSFAVIPVSVRVEDQPRNKVKSDSDFKFTYVGRAEVWKLTPLARLIGDLSKLQREYRQLRFKINVVVSDEKRARSILEELVGLPKGVDVTFFENLSPADLSKLVVNETHIGLAMGTSALDIAKNGVACVLADYSSAPMSGALKYRWIFESDGSSLGRNVEDVGIIVGKSLSQILQEYLDNPHLIDTKSYRYVLTNHDADTNYRQLLKLAISSRLRANDYFVFPFRLFVWSQNVRRKLKGRASYERH